MEAEMKRSEYNRIITNINEFSAKYPIVGIPEEEDECSFNPHGCDCCNGLANDTYDIDCYDVQSAADMQNVNEGDQYEIKICQSCLFIIHSGDSSGLDFSVIEEDEPSID